MLGSITRSYNDQLQVIAQHIFETCDSHAKAQNKDESKDKNENVGNVGRKNKGVVSRSDLAVVAFGGASRHLSGVITEVRAPITFVRGVKRESFGKESMLAVKTSVKRLPDIETSSCILSDV